jgi:ABC-type nitrate/sulfonate/bicarbonate transport system ATPase subunit
MISININSKTYPAQSRSGEHVAIANLQLRVNSGEFVCLVGPSGCGKTTLLNLIAGLDHDFEGHIHFDSQSPTFGYVFQNPRLLPWRTVRENIDLVVENASSPTYVDALLETMQLTPFQHVYPERLSLGMSRRVAIIRAFAINPDVLLMDEPFVSLDAKTAKQIRQLLVSVWQQRPHTVLFVTHDLREAIAIADRIVFLSPAPMKATTEIAVTIPRHQRENEATIETFRQQFFRDYPDLL